MCSILRSSVPAHAELRRDKDVRCRAVGSNAAHIRRARPDDCECVARICTTAFTNETSSRMMAEVPDSPLLDSVLKLESRYSEKAMLDLQDRIQKLAERKHNARVRSYGLSTCPVPPLDRYIQSPTDCAPFLGFNSLLTPQTHADSSAFLPRNAKPVMS